MGLVSPARRRVRPNNRSITGYFSPGPGLPPIPFESRLEHFFLIYLHYKHRLPDVASQPFTLSYRADDGRLRPYTPDFLVRVPGRAPRVFEVKYYRTLRGIWPEYRGRLVAARDQLHARGIQLRVVTDRFLSKAFVANVRLLSSALDEPEPSRDRLEAVLSVARQARHRTIKRLEPELPRWPLPASNADEVSSDIEHPRDNIALLYLIARGHIRVDLRKLLTPSSLYSVDA